MTKNTQGEYGTIGYYEIRYCYNVIKNYLTQGYVKDTQMLDIGCGDGKKTYLLSLLVSNTDIVGLDLSLESLKRAKARGLLVVAGDAKKLPFRDKSFDIATIFHVIEHVSDAKRF